MRTIIIFFLSILINFTASSQVKVNVFDVGAGLFTFISLPDNKYAICDAGGQFNDFGRVGVEKIKKVLDKGAEIEFMAISHEDADHLFAAASILDYFTVKKIIHTGYAKKENEEKKRSSYNKMNDAIHRSILKSNTIEINLKELNRTVLPSDNIRIGDVYFEFLAGSGKIPDSWGLTDDGHLINAASIVVKMTYKKKSVLFMGDAYGRRIGGFAEQLMATEKYLHEHKKYKLKSDVVIASHHGADNGSAKDFCADSSPKYVIFSAGKKNGHPVKQTAERWMKYGKVNYDSILRTDRGAGYKDNTTTNKYSEWSGHSIKGCKDYIGDDDIIISISKKGFLNVDYLNPDPCSK